MSERSGPPALLHYRPWIGTFRPPRSSIWPIARVALILLLRRRLFWMLYAMGLLVFLLFFIGQYLAAYAETTNGGNPFYRSMIHSLFEMLDGTPQSYATYFLWQCNIVMVMLALAGAIVVGNDVRFGSLPFYLSKPVGRWHYLLGKAIAVAVVVNMLTTIPALALYAEHAMLKDWADLYNQQILLAGILGYGAVLTLVLCPLQLATAIWLRRLVPMIMMWTTLFVFCRLLSNSLVDRLKFDARWRLIDLWNDLYLVGNACLQIAPESLRPQPQPAWIEAASLLAGLSLFCISYLIYRIRAVEIVS